MAYQIPLFNDLNITLEGGYTPPKSGDYVILYQGEPPVLDEIILESGYTPPKSGYTVILNTGVAKRIMTGTTLDVFTPIAPSFALSNCTKNHNPSQLIGNDYFARYSQAYTIEGRFYLSILNFYPLSNELKTVYTRSYILANAFAVHYRNLILLANETRIKISDTVGYARCRVVRNAPVIAFKQCLKEPVQSVINLAVCDKQTQARYGISKEIVSRVQEAIPVPCRYYPIPDRPAPPMQGVCDIRPPSSRLPLTLNRVRGSLPSSALPLPLMCWNHQSPTFIPDLRSYIVHNTITATLGGISIAPLDFKIKYDMSGYCWQGSVEITAKDFAKIRHKLEVERGNEPMINVVINGFVFSIIAEEQTRNRQFANHTHTLSGRSVTARLGADYAHAQGGVNGVDGGVINQDFYASQLVQMQLADTGITLDKFGVSDWLIPANTLSVTGKTPIAIIGEIAKACGGFISSHPTEAKLSILPRWKVPVWDIATTNADVVVPAGVGQSISDTKRQNPRYNTIALASGVDGGIVYRELQGRDRQAPFESNPLLTDRDCIVPAGIAILSDSGTHGDYQLKMRWADKYNIPLATVGDVWQFNDTLKGGDGAWKGIVNSCAVSVDWSDGLQVWQTVSIDRYLDV